MSCKHVLSPADLVPVFSFIALRGKCRYCKKKISWQYPIVEIAAGVLFVMIFNYVLRINGLMDYSLISDFRLSTFDFRLFLSLIYYLIVASSLIVIFVYDLRHYIIPDEAILVAVIAAIVYYISIDSTLQFMVASGLGSVYQFDSGGDFLIGFSNMIDFLLLNSIFINHLFAASVSFTFFFLIVFFTKGKGMGGGDVKYGFLMGFIIGWPMITLAILISFIIGSVFGVALVLLKKKGMKSMIAFGPFLVIGTLIMLFWGEKIMRWYLGNIG
jgi:prepilin signal peptidase PulO-like enzyme (type II secretory pathway)